MKLFATVLAGMLLLSGCAIRNAGPGELVRVKPESVGLSSSKLRAAGEAMEDAVSDGTIPGGVLAVVRHGKIAWLEAYGNKSTVPEAEPMTTDTMFDLASCSKCVGTTLSFMQLVEQGKVRLTDRVSLYIPDFKPWTDPQTGEQVEITVRDLLTHSSGIDPYLSVKNMLGRFGGDCPDSLMRVIATEAGRNFRPGTDFMYSCLNFITLQNILQKVTGERLCDYAQENIFNALGLSHTCYFPLDGRPSSPDADFLAGLCAPTEVQEDGLPLVAAVHDPIARLLNSGNSGNAGVFSNAEDLCRIAACLMNGGATGGKRILSPATVRTMFTVPEENDPSVGRALGWDCGSSHSGLKGDLLSRNNSFMHTGYTGPSIVMDLDNDLAVIILTHRVHPTDKGSVGSLRARIANIVAGALTD
ncbi:MAG: serine hydrolase domain-containing protein [Candidatus Cryptobacteroides sp.]